MMVRGDVKCYYCGFVSGQMLGDPDTIGRPLKFRPVDVNSKMLPGKGQPLRCLRCGGPVFLDEVEQLRAPAVARRDTARPRAA